jgi:hypothetical protein
MSNDQNVIKYAKHNKVRIKAGIKREAQQDGGDHN